MRIRIAWTLLVSIALFEASNLFGQELSNYELTSEIEQLNDKFEGSTDKNVQFGLSLGYRFLKEDDRRNYHKASISPIDSTLRLDLIDDNAIILSTSVIFNPRVPTERLSRAINARVTAHVLDWNRDKVVRDIDPMERLVIQDSFFKENDTLGSQLSGSNLKKVSRNATDLDPITSLAIIRNISKAIKKERAAKADKDIIKGLRSDRRSIRSLVVLRGIIDYFIDRISINANLNLIEFSNAQTEFSFNQSLEGGLGISYMLNKNLYIGGNWDVFFSRQLHSHLKSKEGSQLIIGNSVLTDSDELDIEDEDYFITRNLNGISFKIIASF